jgi:hypothetical protein
MIESREVVFSLYLLAVFHCGDTRGQNPVTLVQLKAMREQQKITQSIFLIFYGTAVFGS